jgi:predicted acyl esterase
MVGMSDSSAGATTTFAAASTQHPSLRAFFAQAGASSIYDDVVCEGQSIEMERLWLWVARNIPGLSSSHRDGVMRRFGVSEAELDAVAVSAAARYARLETARQADPPFIESPDWMRLPLTGYPDFVTWSWQTSPRTRSARPFGDRSFRGGRPTIVCSVCSWR